MTPGKRSELRRVMITRTQINHEAKGWTKVDIRPGFFHGFFPYNDGGEAGTLALIELEDGTVTEKGAHEIRFLDAEPGVEL